MTFRIRLGCGTFCTVNSEPAAVVERFISNARHAVGDRHRREALAAVERVLSNARHAFGNRHRREVRAGAERALSNARHAVGDRHRREAGAAAERVISNARYAVGNRILARKRSRSAEERFAVVGIIDTCRVAIR